MLATVRRICGRIMHLQPSLRSQWDKGWKNNSQFASPSIRRPTVISLAKHYKNWGLNRQNILV